MFQQSTTDESEILKLVENHFLPNHMVLQWQLAKGEDIPTPSMDLFFPPVISFAAFSTITKSS
jgi:hypothetical protein